MITLLGENISLVRPAKIHKPFTWGAWRKNRALRTVTNNLTLEEKQTIARSMGLTFKKEKDDE